MLLKTEKIWKEAGRALNWDLYTQPMTCFEMFAMPFNLLTLQMVSVSRTCRLHCLASVILVCIAAKTFAQHARNRLLTSRWSHAQNFSRRGRIKRKVLGWLADRVQSWLTSCRSDNGPVRGTRGPGKLEKFNLQINDEWLLACQSRQTGKIFSRKQTKTFISRTGLEELPVTLSHCEKQLGEKWQLSWMKISLHTKGFKLSTPRRLAVRTLGLADQQTDLIGRF